MSNGNRQVVITGMGVICPLGNDVESLWNALSNRRSGVNWLKQIPSSHLPTRIGGEAWDFDGSVEKFGPLDKMLKRSIKKGLKLMCREISMGVAAAHTAMNHGRLYGEFDPERTGAVFGSDYIMTLPGEFSDGITQCLNGDGEVDFTRWGEFGLPKVDPLWLLKYLPNMPASHVAIYNDLRGPNNSLTVREASANMAIAEAMTIIQRGNADAMVVGATGTRIHPLRTVHLAMQEQLAHSENDPGSASRPFDANRTGMVMGEGAGAIVLEARESAEKRGATIWGELVSYDTSTVANLKGEGDCETALFNVLERSIQRSQIPLSSLGHIHAHGLATTSSDECEARAIARVLGNETVPVTAAKSYMGNLGAGSGMVELVASVLALKEGTLFPILNCDSVDEKCPITPAAEGTLAGDSFVNVSTTPQGQASAVVVRTV